MGTWQRVRFAALLGGAPAQAAVRDQLLDPDARFHQNAWAGLHQAARNGIPVAAELLSHALDHAAATPETFTLIRNAATQPSPSPTLLQNLHRQAVNPQAPFHAQAAGFFGQHPALRPYTTSPGTARADTTSASTTRTDTHAREQVAASERTGKQYAGNAQAGKADSAHETGSPSPGPGTPASPDAPKTAAAGPPAVSWGGKTWTPGSNGWHVAGHDVTFEHGYAGPDGRHVVVTLPKGSHGVFDGSGELVHVVLPGGVSYERGLDGRWGPPRCMRRCR